MLKTLKALPQIGVSQDIKKNFKTPRIVMASIDTSL